MNKQDWLARVRHDKRSVSGKPYKYHFVEDTVSAKTRVIVVCPDHGPWSVLPFSHVSVGCPKCGVLRMQASRKGQPAYDRQTDAQVVARVVARHPGIAFLDTLVDRDSADQIKLTSKWTCVCPVHKTSNSVALRCLLYGGAQGAAYGLNCRTCRAERTAILGKSPSKISKQTATCVERYGGRSPFCSKAVQKKRRATWLRTLGVDNPSKSALVLDKIQASSFRYVDVDLPGGYVVRVQGKNEVDALQWLLDHKIKPRDIQAGKKANFDYRFGGVSRKYFPDFVIVSPLKETWIVEVKSTYTAGLVDNKTAWYGRDLHSKFRAKVKAVIGAGYPLLLLIDNRPIKVRTLADLPSRSQLQSVFRHV